MQTLRPLLLAALLLSAGTATADLSGHPEADRFIDEMVQRHDFPRGELEHLFARTEIRQPILDAIARPAEKKPWHQYRPIFLTEDRIRGGAAFWERHAETLAAAEAEYGVDPAIIVAILGVETRYGRHRGGHRVVDALATLAFEYPPRARFFRSELEQFLLMTREEGIDPLTLQGSYAGAMGQPQFIASSFRNYAVDFDGDGRRDLWENSADVIGSVANYLHRHGWEAGSAIAFPAQVSGETPSALLDAGIRPSLTVAELKAQGIEPPAALADDTPVALLALERKAGEPAHWITLNNFYAITRYNHSPLYAMAVHQLAQAIRSLREGEG